MSGNVFGERYYGRKPAWHVLGKVSTEKRTAVEALEWSGFDYAIELRPLLVDLGSIQVPIDKRGIVRLPTADDDQYRILGTCGPDYTILQNRELCSAIDPLTEQWPVETLGMLGQGETFFLTLDAGEAEIQGDPIRQYFLLADTRNGQSALDVAFTPVRVVCQNTLVAGKAAAVASGTIRHTAQVANELDWRVSLLGQMQQVQGKMLGQFDALARLTLSDAQVTDVIAAAYPYPRRPRKIDLRDNVDAETLAKVTGLATSISAAARTFEVAKARIDERRSVAGELMRQFNDEQPALARTGWAAYNAVVELEDYRAAAGKETETDALVSALFGNRAMTKQRAYEAAYDMVVVR